MTDMSEPKCHTGISHVIDGRGICIYCGYEPPLEITDHKFELSPFCDCADCNLWCHHAYGTSEACLRGRDEHRQSLLLEAK
jgi:hypothetical protein